MLDLLDVRNDRICFKFASTFLVIGTQSQANGLSYVGTSNIYSARLDNCLVLLLSCKIQRNN